MKAPHDYDFRISVQQERWEVDPAESHLYEGIYTVLLNTLVSISFVPDVSRIAPPWDVHEIADRDPVTTDLDARLLTALTSEYTVTPGTKPSGGEDRIPLLPGDLPPWLEESAGPGDRSEVGTVWYVGADEWPGLAAELADLDSRTSLVRFVRHSELGSTYLGRFLDDRFLRSPHLAPEHRRILGRDDNQNHPVVR